MLDLDCRGELLVVKHSISDMYPHKWFQVFNNQQPAFTISHHHPSVRIFNWPSSSYICHLMGRAGILCHANWRTFSFDVSWSWCLIWHCFNLLQMTTFCKSNMNRSKLRPPEHVPTSTTYFHRSSTNFNVLQMTTFCKSNMNPAAGACMLQLQQLISCKQCQIKCQLQLTSYENVL